MKEVPLLSAQMGFFAEAGPVQIFVSNHLIPEDFEFSALDDPCYVSSDEEVVPLLLRRCASLRPP